MTLPMQPPSRDLFNNSTHGASGFSAHMHPFPSRKRHAPPPPQCSFNPPEKRRRPNLAYTLSSLSLDASTASFPPFSPDSHVDEDDAQVGKTQDVEVEEVDTPSSPSSVGTVDSDITFRESRPRRRKRQTLYPDSVEQPVEGVVVDSDLQDITTRPKKRREEDEMDEVEAAGRKKRRMDDMDLDEEVEEIPRQSRPRTRTQWHEPEKDRIVITSLGSDSSCSSRESSPNPNNHNTSNRHLSQPGDQGFTLNTSLLTHLINAQREFGTTQPYPRPSERGLVLYRPLGIEPDRNGSVVQEWNGEPALDTDAGRFEEIDEDEPTGQGWQEDDDMAMDIE